MHHEQPNLICLHFARGMSVLYATSTVVTICMYSPRSIAKDPGKKHKKITSVSESARNQKDRLQAQTGCFEIKSKIR
jgi:hypothetical protein